MKSRLAAFVLTFVMSASAAAPSRADDVNIAVIADGPWERNDAVLAVFREEIVALLGDEFGVTLPDEDVRVADWTLEGIDREIDDALADPDVDVVVGLGVLSSGNLARRQDLPKPVIAPFVIDPEVQGAPLVNGTSGVRNLSYITAVNHFRRDVAAFLQIVPFRSLAVLVTSTVAESVPEMPERTRVIGRELGVDVTIVPVGVSGSEALDGLPAGVEAVYVAPLLRLPESEFDALVAGLIDRKLPSFSLFGREDVERGILAGLTPREEWERIARRTALNIQRILLGEDAAALPVHFSNTEQLSLNVRTARAIGVRPTWAVLTAADQIDRDRTEGRSLTIADAVDEAIAANLDLVAEARAVAAGEQDVGLARSSLLPQIDVSALGAFVDEEQASGSFGLAAERTYSGSVSLSQVIFSDDAWTNLDVNRKLQEQRELMRRQIALDIAQDAATAYLNVLRGGTLERIQRENLERTDANLELARARESIGYSGPGEVYRWEGEVATQRRNVIDANSERNVAEIALNRLLHRPAEEPFVALDVGLESPYLAASDFRLRRYLDDPWSFKVLREFLSGVAQEQSPELQALDLAIAAQERILANTGRAFLVPDVGLVGEVTRTFDRQGAGSDVPGIDPNDTKWTLGVQATLPLFRGGSRPAERRGARQTLDELRTRRESLSEKIEQRLRSATHRAGASFAAIELSQAAAAAAKSNYELVADAYSKGVVSIIELIDAQNSTFVAEQGAASAVYDFLIDYIEAERASGFLSCVERAADRETFLERLEAFRREREGP